jgi:hypothetical protein
LEPTLLQNKIQTVLANRFDEPVSSPFRERRSAINDRLCNAAGSAGIETSSVFAKMKLGKEEWLLVRFRIIREPISEIFHDVSMLGIDPAWLL